VVKKSGTSRWKRSWGTMSHDYYFWSAYFFVKNAENCDPNIEPSVRSHTTCSTDEQGSIKY
jgi:hypothetical protein